jgi:cytochrome b561
LRFSFLSAGQTISYRGGRFASTSGLCIVFGFTLAAVVVAGILWRAIYGRRLQPPERGVRHLLAVATHRLLDLLLLIMVGLGVTNVFAHAFPLFNLWHFRKSATMNS